MKESEVCMDGLTQELVNFVTQTKFNDLPGNVVHGLIPLDVL
jgi:hypothetical protein